MPRTKRPTRGTALIVTLAVAAFVCTAFVLWWQIDVRPRMTIYPSGWDGRRLADCRLQEKDAEYMATPMLTKFLLDGQRLVTCSLRRNDGEKLEGLVQVWHTRSGQELARWPITPDELEENTIALWQASLDGRHVVFRYNRRGNAQGVIRLLDIETGQERSWPARDLRANRLALSPDGRRLAIVSNDGPYRQVLRIVDALNGIEEGSVTERVRKSQNDVAETIFGNMTFLPDGRTLAFTVTHANSRASWRKQRRAANAITLVALWDIPDKRIRSRINVGEAWAVAFAPDGKNVAVSMSHFLRLWDLSTGRVANSRNLKSDGSFDRLRYSEDGSRLLAMSSIPDSGMGVSVVTDTPGPFSRIAIFDSRSLATLSAFNARSTPESIFNEFDDPSGSLLPKYREHRHQQVKTDGRGTRLDEGKVMVTVSETISGRDIFTFPDHEGNSNAGIETGYRELSPDRRLFVLSQSKEKKNLLREWLSKYVPGIQPPARERESWLRCLDLTTGHEYPVLPDCEWSLAFSQDGRMLATISKDGTIKLWDLPPRKPLGLILAWSSVPAALVLLLGWWRGRRARIGNAEVAKLSAGGN